MATTLERKNIQLPVQRNTLPAKFLVWHCVGLAVFGALFGYLTYLNFLPVIEASGAAGASQEIHLPAYDYEPFRAMPVLHEARIKPFESAAREICLYIHGRHRVLGHNAVPVVLSWMLEKSPRSVDRTGSWDDKEFIRCEHRDARKMILGLQEDGSIKLDKLNFEDIHGHFLSPKQLKAFRKVLLNIEQSNKRRFDELSSEMNRDVEQALDRLSKYEFIRTPFAKWEETARQRKMTGSERFRDPLGLVALDHVPGAPWFSQAEMEEISRDPQQWYNQLKERVKDMPQLYLTPEHKQALANFQGKVQAGQGKTAVADLKSVLAERREKLVQEYRNLRGQKKTKEAADLIAHELLIWPWLSSTLAGSAEEKNNLLLYKNSVRLLDEANESRRDKLILGLKSGQAAVLAEILTTDSMESEQVAEAFTQFLAERDQRAGGPIDSIEHRLPNPSVYAPVKPEYRILHMSYLETRFPKLYQEAAQGQPPPLESIQVVLTRFEALSDAYDKGDPAKFDQARNDFFTTVKQVSEEETKHTFPGDDTISDRLGDLVTGQSTSMPGSQLMDLELTFNQLRPYMWAWILMLGATVVLVFAMGFSSRYCYMAGLAIYGLSLGFQAFGFFTRVVISGRPPVATMYETVIWVSFMTSVFALILESIYRRRVIALAGAMVATLGLVLADQMPLALDPKITGLQAVLRSNFWLTIHVITIVSSYGGGALAWGLGNLSLILLVFGLGSKETIKTLSNFTYRAMQIAVLLLAAGTFLGGWWAAYSWGRFWGWDPKENGALIALLCYVIPLHMRYIGWIKDFGTAIAAIVCFAAIMTSWYGVNFIFPAGLHAYADGGGGATWVYWAACINLQWVLVASLIYRRKQLQTLSLQTS
jgi:ABC-type transport system involved in cytochrome c biogenesis permease subunit